MRAVVRAASAAKLESAVNGVSLENRDLPNGNRRGLQCGFRGVRDS
jgi:hypothetical protein